MPFSDRLIFNRTNQEAFARLYPVSLSFLKRRRGDEGSSTFLDFPIHPSFFFMYNRTQKKFTFHPFGTMLRCRVALLIVRKVEVICETVFGLNFFRFAVCLKPFVYSKSTSWTVSRGVDRSRDVMYGTGMWCRFEVRQTLFNFFFLFFFPLPHHHFLLNSFFSISSSHILLFSGSSRNLS